jgi:hypothetical protein
MILDDNQFQNMFEMYASDMHCKVLLIVVDNTLFQNHILPQQDRAPLELDPLEIEFPTLQSDQPPIATEPAPTIPTEPDPTIPTEPEPTKATQSSNPNDEPDIFDNLEEYVGVNDEHMYIAVPPARPSIPTNEPNECASDEGAIPPEEEVNDADPEEIRVLHDPHNPIIKEGALFPDIVAFRKAIRHFVVTIGFEFAKGVKSDPTRFIGKCKHPGCPWRIHASRIHDQKTIQVHKSSSCINSVFTCILLTAIFSVQIKVLPEKHNCPTTKLVEGKMSSQSWVAGRLTDWLKKNPNKGPMQQRRRLREIME